eukprot:g938.t1
MSQSPEKRRCTGNEPQNAGARQKGFSFDAPGLNPASAPRPGRQQNATGLAVPKAADRGRSWDGAKDPKGSEPKLRPGVSPHAKSASPVPCREVKRPSKEGAGNRAPEPKAASSPVKRPAGAMRRRFHAALLVASISCFNRFRS